MNSLQPGFTRFFDNGFGLVCGLSSVEVRILLFMSLRLSWDNGYSISPGNRGLLLDAIYDDSSVTGYTRFSKALKSMESKGVICRPGGKMVFVNPHILYAGDFKNYGLVKQIWKQKLFEAQQRIVVKLKQH